MLRKRAHLSKAEYEALASFRYALRKFLRFSEEKALAEGLPPQQHQALLAIKGFPGRDSVTIGELAERLQTEHHSAVGLADRLAKEGYLKRVRGTGDRRQVFVELTPRGEKVLAKLSMVHEEQLKQVGPEIAKLLCHLTEQDSKQSPKGKKPSSGRSPKPTKRS